MKENTLPSVKNRKTGNGQQKKKNTHGGAPQWY